MSIGNGLDGGDDPAEAKTTIALLAKAFELEDQEADTESEGEQASLNQQDEVVVDQEKMRLGNEDSEHYDDVEATIRMEQSCRGPLVNVEAATLINELSRAAEINEINATLINESVHQRGMEESNATPVDVCIRALAEPAQQFGNQLALPVDVTLEADGSDVSEISDDEQVQDANQDGEWEWEKEQEEEARGELGVEQNTSQPFGQVIGAHRNAAGANRFELQQVNSKTFVLQAQEMCEEIMHAASPNESDVPTITSNATSELDEDNVVKDTDTLPSGNASKVAVEADWRRKPVAMPRQLAPRRSLGEEPSSPPPRPMLAERLGGVGSKQSSWHPSANAPSSGGDWHESYHPQLEKVTTHVPRDDQHMAVTFTSSGDWRESYRPQLEKTTTHVSRDDQPYMAATSKSRPQMHPQASESKLVDRTSMINALRPKSASPVPPPPPPQPEQQGFPHQVQQQLPQPFKLPPWKRLEPPVTLPPLPPLPPLQALLPPHIASVHAQPHPPTQPSPPSTPPSHAQQQFQQSFGFQQAVGPCGFPVSSPMLAGVGSFGFPGTSFPSIQGPLALAQADRDTQARHVEEALRAAETTRPARSSGLSLREQALEWKARADEKAAAEKKLSEYSARLLGEAPSDDASASTSRLACSGSPTDAIAKKRSSALAGSDSGDSNATSLQAAAESLAAAFSSNAFDEEPLTKRPRLGDASEGLDEKPPPLPKEQGPLLPDAPRVGWLPAQTRCSRCRKLVIARGGVFCGRSLAPSGAVRGCAAGICWRCMKRATREELGKIRTTKAEFESLGDSAWWMHESCMQPDDKLEYYASGGGDAEMTAAGVAASTGDQPFEWE